MEDHEPTLTVLRRLLLRDGYEVTTATSVATALAAAEVGQFDIVISDLGLPDGTGIELQVDTFPTKQEAQAWFGRDEFRENPIGVLFDPEELLKAFEAGVPEDELLTRPKGGAAPSLAARG